jgi:hypothetical protein
MPFRPWGFRGEPPPRPGLVRILWGQEHAARQDTPAARSTPATPTARRPGQHLTAVRTSAPPRFLRGHRCCPGPPAPACRARDPMRPASRPRQPLTKPLPCPPRPGRRHSPPIPLTPASTPNRPLPPRLRHPATAGHHTGDITNGQPTPNAESGDLIAVPIAWAVAYRLSIKGVSGSSLVCEQVSRRGRERWSSASAGSV